LVQARRYVKDYGRAREIGRRQGGLVRERETKEATALDLAVLDENLMRAATAREQDIFKEAFGEAADPEMSLSDENENDDGEDDTDEDDDDSDDGDSEAWEK
jgi:hypothetical protein